MTLMITMIVVFLTSSDDGNEVRFISARDVCRTKLADSFLLSCSSFHDCFATALLPSDKLSVCRPSTN